MKDILTTFAVNNLNNVGADGKDNNLQPAITAIINGVISVLGIAAVVIIIAGGVQYMTSSGDSGKVKKAKDTILYGVIGLVICVLAFAITNFIIGIVNTGASATK